MNNGVRKNSLTHQQFYQLCSTIQAKAKDFATRRLSYPEARTELSGMLGFPVSEANLLSARHTTGVDWGAQRKMIERTMPDKATIYESLRIVAAALRGLYESLGQPVPDNLNAICRKDGAA